MKEGEKRVDKKIIDLEWVNENKENKEKFDRKNNIIIKGVEWETERLEQEVAKFMKEELEIEVEIKKVNKIGIKGKDSMII